MPSRILKAFRLVLLTLLACAGLAAAEVPGGPTVEHFCTFRCNWEGYELTVSSLPEGEVLTVDRRPQLQYANGRRVEGLVGSLSPDPGRGIQVTRVATGASVHDSYCNYEGFPLTGTVFLLERPVQQHYPFEAGSTPPLGLTGLCYGRSLDQLRQIYNSYVDVTRQVPFCSYYLPPQTGRIQGCRKAPSTGSTRPGSGSIGPTGHTPAQFGRPDEVPDDYDKCKNWDFDGLDLEGKPKWKCIDDWVEGGAAGGQPGSASSCAGGQAWTPWLNRDNQAGSGDFETLRDFQASSQACRQPLGVECQTLDGRDWRAAGQNCLCDAAKGGICRNDQNAGRCLDYRVRFLCCKS